MTGRSLAPPTLELGADHEALRGRVRRFIADELTAGGFEPRVDSWQSGWDPEFSRRLGAEGFLGCVIPIEYGGQGLSSVDRYVIVEELLAAGAPIAAHWVADRQIAPSLLRYGSEYLKRRYLPAIAAGESYWAIGLSEPDAGSDLAAVRTSATQVEGGWRLSGTKVWTSGAHRSHAFFVLARTSEPEGRSRHAGLSQFTVELDQPGVTVNPIPWLDGDHHFNEVVLDDVFVPDEMVLGTIGNGWAQATSELAHERSGPERFLSVAVLLRQLVEELRRADADAWDADAVGRLVSRLWAIRQMSLAVSGALARGELPDVAAALVKDLGTRLEGAIVDTVRLTAGSGRLSPALVGLVDYAILHAPGFTIRGGTNEILRGVVARALGVR
jgi:alkylation response protein AidB-like acyl-CoA dehydrogenase